MLPPTTDGSSLFPAITDQISEENLVAREREDAAAAGPATPAGVPGQAEDDLPRDGRRQEGEGVSVCFFPIPWRCSEEFL